MLPPTKNAEVTELAKATFAAHGRLSAKKILRNPVPNIFVVKACNPFCSPYSPTNTVAKS